MSSPSVELPDELILEIISRVRTLNVLVRCNSLLSKRWRNKWRSIIVDGGVLDFDKSGQLEPIEYDALVQWRKPTMSEEQRRFATIVDQAVNSLRHRRNLDGLVIRFDLSCMSQHASRWIEFGLTKRVKELVLTSRSLLSIPILTPDSLARHDLGRLEVLELGGIREMPPATIDHIFSNCPSLRIFALRNCYIAGGNIAIKVRNCDNLESFTLDIEGLAHCVTIELLHAPRLRTFEFSGEGSQVEFGDNLPRLEKVRFGAEWLCSAGYLSRSPTQFQKYAPRLDRLGLHLGHNHYLHRRVPIHSGLVFEKLRVLDLATYICYGDFCLQDCITLLMAAPLLRQLSIWFADVCDPLCLIGTAYRTGSVTPYLATVDLPSWKHHSLEVLQLHGLHHARADSNFAYARKLELQLAACIMRIAPSLNQVLIDTRHLSSNHWPTTEAVESRLPDQIDRDISEAKMELEACLRGRSARANIRFTYR